MRATFTTAKFWPPPAGPWCTGAPGRRFCGVSTDSRTCQTGELFIPLTGERHDGHEFIPAALRRGARGVLVESQGPARRAPWGAA